MEERFHSLAHGTVLSLDPSGMGIVTEFLRNHQEQVICMRTNVGLPQVQEIHVVRGCLSPLHFPQDSGVGNGKEIIRSKLAIAVFGEEPLCLTCETKLGREVEVDLLNAEARLAWRIGFSGGGKHRSLIHVFKQCIADL